VQDRPRQDVVAVAGAELCYFDWPCIDSGADTGTTLLTHATGFHARVWDQVIAALPEPLRSQRIIAWEARGHGRSSKRGPFDWNTCGQDLVAFIDALDLEHVVIAGHSMGGHLAVLAAIARPQRIQRLVLIDPVIPPPPAEPRPGPLMDAATHPVARRRNLWDGAGHMIEHFAGRAPYSLWQRAVLEDYCRHGLLPNPDGAGYVLACPPLIEATFYSHSPFTSDQIYGPLGSVRQPVLVVRARRSTSGERQQMDFSNSPTWPDLAQALPNARDVYLPDLTHFIPMQDPALTARLIAEQP
jgi:pimeloyl-ACP methyl ester carboxylesterase